MDPTNKPQITDIYHPSLRPVDATAPIDLEDPAQETAAQVVATEADVFVTHKRKRALAILVLACILAVGIALPTYLATRRHAPVADASKRISSQTLPTGELSAPIPDTDQQDELKVNGELAVKGSLTLQPGGQPAAPREGQLYYDQQGKHLSFYNGSDFVALGGGSVLVTNVGGLTVTNITNVTNTGSGLNITGSPGSLALISGQGTLAGSMLTQQGNTLTTEPGIQNVSLGSVGGASTTLLQSGTGNLTIQTGSVASGSSGSISMISGSSAATASGNVTIDTGTGIVSGTIVESLSFETGTEHFEYGYGATTTRAQDCTIARTGNCSLAMSGSLFSGIGQNFNFPGAPVIPGHRYLVSIWVRAQSAGTTISGYASWGSSIFALGSVTDNSTGWTQMIGSGVAPAGSTQAFLQNLAFSVTPDQTHYFDDFTVTDLSSSSAVSELSLGAANAQFVTLGNDSEIGLTTIRGGSGIRLDSGAADMTLSGGAMTLTASGASTLATTSGTLRLESATTATWGIKAPDTGNGGSLTLHSGTGGFGNNNGGDLILQPGAGTGTGISGSVIVRPQSDTGLAFQLQDSTSVALLTANTTTHTISVTGTPTAFATLSLQDGHFKSTQTTPPAIGAPASCGAGATANLLPGATDTAGSFTITTGTDGTASTCATTIAFTTPYGAKPKAIIVQGREDIASVQRQIFQSGATATGFTVSFGTSAAGANNTTYSFNYWVVE